MEAGSTCSGLCESCNQSGRLGFCDAVPAGQDPSLECATAAASTFGTTGVCSGARSCQLYPSSTVCAAAFCPAQAMARPAATCSGFGACVTRADVSCGNYACNAATGACRVTCSVPSDCATGRTCSSGQCL